MTKDEWVRLILNNAEEFNNQKAAFNDAVDLSETEFSGAEIKDVNLSDIDFTGSNFAECNIVNVNFSSADLTGTDFARAHIAECDFSHAILNGSDMSYSTVHFCNFTDTDMSGSVLNEADLSDSDFSASENLSACRFDDGTVWPDSDKLPEEFDSTYSYDLSSLKDEEDEVESPDFGY